VNLAVFGPQGNLTAVTDVPLRQPGDEELAGIYCEWMPYQQQVARGEIPPVLHADAPQKG
jgi:hypothetical protein